MLRRIIARGARKGYVVRKKAACGSGGLFVDNPKATDSCGCSFSFASLRRKVRRQETAAVNQADEARIAAAWIPLGIDGQENQVNVSHLISKLQPLHGLVPVAEAEMNLRHRIRWNEVIAGNRFQRGQHFKRFAGPS
jgi:hypothetical protein